MFDADSTAPVTLRDIAQKLRLNHSTVSLALRESPKIPEHRRREIQRVAAEMGYRPNPSASALARFKKNVGHEEIGRVAVLVLASLIADNSRGVPPIPREILISGAWVEGRSLRRPRGK